MGQQFINNSLLLRDNSLLIIIILLIVFSVILKFEVLVQSVECTVAGLIL